MKILRNNMYLYLVLVIVMITYIVFIFNKNTDIETKLDEVKLKTEINEISKNSFAIMIEKEDGSGYEEVDEFPLDYMFNEELSGCIDIDGKSLESALSYDNGVVTVNVNSTAYCYLYFDYNPIPKEFTFYIGGTSNPEYVTSTNTTAYLSWEDTNITYYCVTNTQGSDNCTWNEVSGNSIDTSHTLTSGDGTKTVYAYLKNSVGNISPEVSDTIYLDTTTPTNNSILINSGDSYTTSTSVTLTLTSTDVAEMCISNTDSCSLWETYATSKSHTLSSGDGTKTVYVWFKDAAGNQTSYVTDTITLDTAAPTSNSVSINSGATYTTSTSVTLTLSSSGATQMCISNTSSCSSWVTYATSKTWTLNNSTNGTKTVYVWFRDAAGNTTSYVTDTITLDTTAPTSNSVSINSGAASTSSTSVTLTLASTGATQMCISNTSSCSSWVTYATSKSWTLTTGDGTKTVYVWYRDAAGNQTSYVTDTITLSTVTYVCTTNTALGSCLKSAKTAGFNSTMEGGLYRYQGTTDVNNYVCFGTTDKSTCTGNINRYMYRIIGIDSSNRVKLIKKEYLYRTNWYSDNTNITWPNSVIYSDINGGQFYTNTTYVPSGWSDKIATMSWKYGDNSLSGNNSAEELYDVENAWTDTVSAKIGLLYTHDYAYSYQTGGLNCGYSSGNADLCSSSWMFNGYEWLMSRSSYNSVTDSYNAWYVYYTGILTANQLTNTFSVRPVFFLTTSVKYISGSGTASDPFIIS